VGRRATRGRGQETKTDALIAVLEPSPRMRSLPALIAVICFAAMPALGWEHWGGDQGGTRFSPLAQITPGNVGNLVRAWEFRTGDLDARAPAVMARTKFEATPLFVEDSLIFCSPFNEVIPAPAFRNGGTIPKLTPTSDPQIVTTAAASPIGSTIRPPKMPLAGRGFSWAPTMSA
jgi:glucose dehydrogenase